MIKFKKIFLSFISSFIVICLYSPVYGGLFDWFDKPTLTENQIKWQIYKRMSMVVKK